MIQEQAGDLWDYSARGEWIAITTNGITKANGQAVMGAGLAKQAATRYPDLPSWLGQRLMRFGNRPCNDASNSCTHLQLQAIEFTDLYRNERSDQLSCTKQVGWKVATVMYSAE